MFLKFKCCLLDFQLLILKGPLQKMRSIKSLSSEEMRYIRQGGKLWRWKRSHHQWLLQFKWRWQKPWKLLQLLKHSDEIALSSGHHLVVRWAYKSIIYRFRRHYNSGISLFLIEKFKPQEIYFTVTEIYFTRAVQCKSETACSDWENWKVFGTWK